jgi:hypothetical protein
MVVTFPNTPAVYTDQWISFKALVDGVTTPCCIEHEAIQDVFGVPSHAQMDLLSAFESGKSVVHQIARAKLQNFPGAGLCFECGRFPGVRLME